MGAKARHTHHRPVCLLVQAPERAIRRTSPLTTTQSESGVECFATSAEVRRAIVVLYMRSQSAKGATVSRRS